MELFSIASGSSGNCIMAGQGDGRLLIDAGVSGKRIEQGLIALGYRTSDMKGVLVTHEHMDHISGLGVIARKHGIPIYASQGTKEAILKTKSVGEVDESLFHVIRADEAFWIGDLKIEPVKISHDAAEPTAYMIRCQDKSAGIITDLGTYDDYIIEKLKGVNLLLLEANHDVNMLLTGPYPYFLKQRIRGGLGHLSNELSGRLLSRLLHDKLKTVFLGHLSKENNLAELAYETVRLEISMADNPYKPDDFPIYVANRSEMSQLVEI